MKGDSGVFRWLNSAATPFIDLLTIVGCSALLPLLVTLFNKRGWSGFLVVIGGYFFMCAGIFIGKKLEPWPLADQQTGTVKSEGGCVIALSWPYAIFVVVMGLDSGGAFKRNSEMWTQLDNLTGGSNLILIPVILVFLIILILFPLLLMMKPKFSIRHGRPAHTLLRLFSVTSIDLMALITAAYWQWQLSGSEPMQIGLAGKILVFLLGYVIFLMLYAPPRLALISLEPSRWSFTGYAILLGYILWGFIG
jgi:hypothetical protein